MDSQRSRAWALHLPPEGVTVHLTGPAGLSADLIGAFAGIDGLLLGVALLVVLVILLFVYRSILLPVAVLSTSLFALCAALLTIWWLAKWGILLLSGQTQGLLPTPRRPLPRGAAGDSGRLAGLLESSQGLG